MNVITFDDVRVEVITAPLTHAHDQPTAVRLIHISSGISVVCDVYNSQHRNKAGALVMLMAKIKLQKVLDFVGVQVVNESRKFEPNVGVLDTLESIENFIKQVMVGDTQ